MPEGVLFGSTGAHRVPGGVFNPCSGVKTSVLVFRKGGAALSVPTSCR